MALFLNDHLPDKIALLGQWKSGELLVYIRPHVTEWCNLYSIDMISLNHYFQLFATTKQQKSKLKRKEIRRLDYLMPHYMCGYLGMAVKYVSKCYFCQRFSKGAQKETGDQ